jgi:hypothetical protein
MQTVCMSRPPFGLTNLSHLGQFAPFNLPGNANTKIHVENLFYFRIVVYIGFAPEAHEHNKHKLTGSIRATYTGKIIFLKGLVFRATFLCICCYYYLNQECVMESLTQFGTENIARNIHFKRYY